MGMGLFGPFGYTWFHMDGQGMLDSGHFCKEGYSHVVILRCLELDEIIKAKKDISQDEEVRTNL